MSEFSVITLNLVSRRTGNPANDGFDDVLISVKYGYNEKTLVNIFKNCE